MEQFIEDSAKNVKMEELGENFKVLPKRKSKRVIRRLAKDKVRQERLAAKSTLKSCMLFISAVLIAIGIYYFNDCNPFKDFQRIYNKHYNTIVHDAPNYCDHEFDVAQWLQPIRKNVHHQHAAMKEFELAVQNQSQILRIAITGSSGVGKTLFTTALAQNFPWPQNARNFAWNTYKPILDKVRILRGFVDDFSECGSNLLVLDNLRVHDRDVIEKMNHLLANMSDAAKKRIIVVYVFHLNAMLDADDYAVDFGQVQQLPQTKTVNFKPFDVDEVKHCIRLEAAIKKYKLSEKSFQEIVASIDPKQSGCKKVYAKLRMYGLSDKAEEVEP